MSDARSRALARAQLADPAQRAAWLADRVRRGGLAAERVALAAYAGDTAADLACPASARISPRVLGTLGWWIGDLCAHGGMVATVRAALGVFELEYPDWETEHREVCRSTCGGNGRCLAGHVRLVRFQASHWADSADVNDRPMMIAKAHSARWRGERVMERAPRLRWAFTPALCVTAAGVVEATQDDGDEGRLAARAIRDRAIGVVIAAAEDALTRWSEAEVRGAIGAPVARWALR